MSLIDTFQILVPYTYMIIVKFFCIHHMIHFILTKYNILYVKFIDDLDTRVARRRISALI